MSNFVKQGNTFIVVPDGAMDVRKHLPLGTYSVGLSMQGFYLEQVPNIELKNKFYGNVQRRCDRVLNTFNSREGSTGVLLAGKKGTGKTMLSKLISIQGREKYGAITVIVNSTFHGEPFNRFMSEITQPCIVIFDEFEKTYKPEEQNSLLTLFDGVYPTKKLFLLTTNVAAGINTYMLSRPGRIFYKFDYSEIPEEEIREYVTDKIGNEKKVEEVMDGLALVSDISYDILSAVCEDVNRYPADTIGEILSYLNVNNSGRDNQYRPKVIEGIAVELIEPSFLERGLFNYGASFNPVIDEFAVPVLYSADNEKNKGRISKYVNLGPEHVTKFSRNTVTYQLPDEGITIELERVPERHEKDIFSHNIPQASASVIDFKKKGGVITLDRN